MSDKNAQLKAKIREVLDFPTPGIKFKDITPLMEDRTAFRTTVRGLYKAFKSDRIDKVVGIDARGFLLASAVAYLLNAGLVVVRKKGKLPYTKIIQLHDLEYGSASLEIHVDAIAKGERVLIIDDVLATGGTAGAAAKLVKKLGGKLVGLGFLLELSEFNGRKKFKGKKIRSVITF